MCLFFEDDKITLSESKRGIFMLAEKNMRVVVRGAGDLASGVIAKLYRSGFEVAALECEKPSSIRRTVSFSEAVYQKEVTVEGITAKLADEENAEDILAEGNVPVLVDPEGEWIESWKPQIVVDAILAKKNLGTRMDMAEITIGLGPGFEAGVDVHAVIETKRGHSLGRIYYQGTAIPNTGIPGKIAGYAKERVIYAPVEGTLRSCAAIGDAVKKGQMIATIGGHPVNASIDGILRGILPDGFRVREGFKMADIDPRPLGGQECSSISDKARCIAGGVLEAILYLRQGRDRKNGTEKPEFSLISMLKIRPEKHRLIAVVGAGGKTTLIYELARELKKAGYRAAVTTTTHMYKEGRYGFVPVGNGVSGEKLTGVSPEVPRGMLETYDVVLVEADGSHGLPLKCPASFEPVIPVETDLVIGVAGASAVGKSFREKCHRFETACQSLGRLPEDLITEQDVIRCLTEKFGQKKNVDCEYRYVVNQAEVLSKKQMERLLYFQKSQTDIGVVISFSMERWYNS